MNQLEKAVTVIKMLITMFFEDGVPMLAQNLLDGMRAIPCLRWTVEFIMGLSDVCCWWIAAVLGALAILASVVGMVWIGRSNGDSCGVAGKGVLLLCAVLPASFGVMALVFIAAAII